jgi:hypothetical protein
VAIVDSHLKAGSEAVLLSSFQEILGLVFYSLEGLLPYSIPLMVILQFSTCFFDLAKYNISPYLYYLSGPFQELGSFYFPSALPAFKYFILFLFIHKF